MIDDIHALKAKIAELETRLSALESASHKKHVEPETFPISLKFSDDVSVCDIGLSTRARNGLLNAGVKTVGDFRRKKSRREMLRENNFGKKSLLEVERLLGSLPKYAEE